MGKSIYKTPEARQSLMRLYDRKLAELGLDCESIRVETFAGETHILAAGPADGPPVVLFHGINAGAPLTLEAVKGLAGRYRLYGIDTPGQATRSAETRLPLNDNSLGRWAEEVLDGLGLEQAAVIGVSYGAFLLQKLMQQAPGRIGKAIFVVPGGLVNGDPLPTLRRVSLPLLRFMVTKSDRHLARFLDAFMHNAGPFELEMQRTLLLGFRMDYRRPPLLRAEDVARLTAPVHVMVADNDVFFPGDRALERCRAMFSNLAGYHVLENSKHMPARYRFPEIQAKIREWLDSGDSEISKV
jgi:pimeloyl-ACP methyl ester carboxylesterase